MAKKDTKLTLKKIWGYIHLWGGLASGIVVLIVSITGCIFVFEEEIRNITQKEFRFVEPQKQAKISLAEATNTINTQYPKMKIEQIRLFSDPNRTIIAKLIENKNENPKAKSEVQKGKKENEMAGKKVTISLNPYTGVIIGTWNMDKDFLHFVEEMHVNLLLGDVGKWLIKINIVVFLVMLISGFVLWFPRKKNQMRTAFKMKFNTKFQLLNYNFHNVFGFYFLLPLFLVTFTGMWWAIKPVQKGVYAVLGEKMKEPKKSISVPQEGKLFTPNQAFETVKNQYAGWNEAHINFAKNEKECVKVNLRYPYEIVKKQNVFEFDQYSGEMLKTELFANYSAGDKVKHANRDLHTGKAFGLFGKILMFLASLFSATLPITGMLIWYNRKYKKSAKKVVRPQQAVKPQFATV
ncbi:MAG: PepSY-associated TM helix domain-containing protein [Arcicella sp.]|nr:PepSY-associated TM helix domain-containing protein [Arcicella sp.]